VHVGEELHLDRLGALATARFTAATRHVEREETRRVTALFRERRGGEALAQRVPYLEVGRGVAARCRTAGVEVVDLPEVFAALPAPAPGEEPWYEPGDTHWSQRGLHVAADAIIETIGWARVPGVYQVREEMVRRPADLERLRAVAPAADDRSKEACLVVADAQGRAPATPPAGAEVLLLGDSFCRIFEEGEVTGAGLRSQLAWRLGRPVGLIRQDGGGATLVRQELARHPERLRGVKVVVWEFAERDLLAAETEWAKVELPR
jgi:hypothetical protein